MEFGLQLHGLELSRLHDVAQSAEALGFSFLTLPDHYRYEGPERSLDLRWGARGGEAGERPSKV